MKDDKLEKEFDEYFKGVNIPDDITADAKKSVRQKRSIMPKIAKFASIAASIVLVFAVALAVILKTDFNKADGNESDAPGTTQPGSDNSSENASGDTDNSGGAKFRFFAESDLSQRNENAYALSSLDPSLKLIEKFAYAKNASVETCKAGYMDGKLMLVTAKVNIISGLTRDETSIFVEFTDKDLIYGELADYYDGEIYYYGSAQYYLTQTTAQNGEPEFKLHILYKGVKYYFNVHSSDKNAYEKYLNFVTEK